MIYPNSRVVRQRMAREKRVAAERRRHELIALLARTKEEEANLSGLSLGELICMKNVQPTLFDYPKENDQ